MCLSITTYNLSKILKYKNIYLNINLNMNLNTLLFINEHYTEGYKVEFLNLLSLVSIFCAILVIVTKNPVVSVLYLIGLFFGISVYLMAIGVTYIGLSYLLVYVGAVSILFLFILMLINVRISEILSNTGNSIPLAIITVIAFNYSRTEILPYSENISAYHSLLYFFNFFEAFISENLNPFFFMLNAFADNAKILFVTSSSWDSSLSEISHIKSIGNIMYTSHSMWLILTSIILLLSMVGAIVVTKQGTPSSVTKKA